MNISAMAPPTEVAAYTAAARRRRMRSAPSMATPRFVDSLGTITRQRGVCTARKRGRLLEPAPMRSQQFFDAVALFAQLFFRRIHAAAAELIDGEALHHLVLTIAASDGVGIDETFLDAVA